VNRERPWILDGSRICQVIPCNDLIDHEPGADCPCGPTTEAVKRDDGTVGWLVTHHSLDGRERFEEDR
jgi:hypothetical protein